MTLQQESNYEGNWAEVLDVIQETKAVLYPDWSDERLICDTPEADKFCKEVRKRLDAVIKDLPNHIINRALFGLRKNPPAETTP